MTATDAPLAATPTTVEEVLGEVRTLTAEVTLAEPEAPVVELPDDLVAATRRAVADYHAGVRDRAPEWLNLRLEGGNR